MVCAFLGLLGAGAWFYYFYFMSTNSITRHAENFMFRRMTVAQLAEQGKYRFFFITNRVQEHAEGLYEESFGANRENKLKFGLFDTTIEPSLGLGMIINPTEWFQNEEIHQTQRQHEQDFPV